MAWNWPVWQRSPAARTLPTKYSYSLFASSGRAAASNDGRLPRRVSPFAKPHYISHTPMDYTAVLKFVEKRFNLPSLNARDAAQADMEEFFDFSSPNLNPPSPATQPINLPCNPNLASGTKNVPFPQ